MATPTGTAVTAATGEQKQPAVAWGAGTHLVVWTDFAKGNADVMSARTDPLGASKTPLPVSATTAAEESPQVASNGTTFLVIWTDSRNFSANGSDIYGALVSPASGKVTVGPFAVASNTPKEHTPVVASDGKDYLVAWLDYTAGQFSPAIMAAKVTSAGVPKTAQEAAKADKNKSNLALTYGAGRFLLVWQDSRNSAAPNLDIYGQRLTIDGAKLLTEVRMVSPPTTSTKLYPSVAGSPQGFLVAWLEGSKAINGALVGATGGPTVKAIRSVSSDTVSRPAVTFDGCKYVAFWSENATNTLGWDVLARDISASGALGAAAPKISISFDQLELAASSNGQERSLAVFKDSRSSTLSPPKTVWDIYAYGYKPKPP